MDVPLSSTRMVEDWKYSLSLSLSLSLSPFLFFSYLLSFLSFFSLATVRWINASARGRTLASLSVPGTSDGLFRSSSRTYQATKDSIVRGRCETGYLIRWVCNWVPNLHEFICTGRDTVPARIGRRVPDKGAAFSFRNRVSVDDTTYAWTIRGTRRHQSLLSDRIGRSQFGLFAVSIV